MEITDSACVPTFSFPFALDCHQYYELMVTQGEGRSPMTSSDTETGSKLIIIYYCITRRRTYVVVGAGEHCVAAGVPVLRLTADKVRLGGVLDAALGPDGDDPAGGVGAVKPLPLQVSTPHFRSRHFFVHFFIFCN